MLNTGETSVLKPMSAAPTNGEIILSFWGTDPVLIAWIDMPDRKRVYSKGLWPFVSRVVEILPERGWRILMLRREGGYAVHGNYGPYSPPGWLPIPSVSPPAASDPKGQASAPLSDEAGHAPEVPHE